MTVWAAGPSRPLPRWARLPLAIGFGMVIGLGAAPFDLWYVALLGYVGAFWLFLNAPRGIHAVGTGWAVGFGYFGLSLGWIVEPFMVDAAETGWMAPFGLLGLAGGLALFWALAFWLAGHARRAPLATLVLAWSAAELARAYVFTGFPWGLVGYLWAPSAGIQWVSVIGPHGLTLVTLALTAHAARVLRAPSRLGAAALVAALIAVLGGGALLMPPEQDLSKRPIVRLIQPNAAQHEKWNPDLVPIFFNRQLTYTAAPTETPDAPRPALVVWPETSVPGLLHRSGDMLAMISEAAQGSPVALGIQRYEGGGYFNSLAVLDGYGDVAQVYDKHHLVPFGEYMPAAGVFKRWNIAGLAARAEGGYSPGPGPALINLGPLGLALPLICYEAVFPQDVHRAPQRPDLLLQITNDAWFGQWSGPYQHLRQARIRAIEQGLPMARAANTGVSAMIDGGGRITAELGLGVAGYLDAPLPAPARITIYSRTGDLPALVLLFLASLALFLLRNRNAH
ncbi:apolipoprotein N-acyltransferase [Tropicibacter oceani]|uniref:Apolipoprotein N-acyltransferase n=1 Tax=Tropicibacter oceani TaxID=3058420 RepID=A0ABY8QN62_9RHOB|nr:apolipoprotein N-acyltransferase [Tropicibacter oceani]WGW05461.1 apolipoprotein N-acyltransferase [Tropicibacter oceani]